MKIPRLVTAGCLVAVALSAHASTITVDSLSDASGCSLRHAIISANTNTASATCVAGTSGSDAITIAVTGTYQPTSASPAVVEPVVLDGNADFVVNGSAAGATDGLVLAAGSGGSTIRNLAVVAFTGSGIVVRSSGNEIASCRIGAGGAPNVVGGTGAGLLVEDDAGETISGNIIRSTEVSFNANDGIRIQPRSGRVTGTRIFTSSARHNNGYGLRIINAEATQVGEASAGYIGNPAVLNRFSQNGHGDVFVSLNTPGINSLTTFVENEIGSDEPQANTLFTVADSSAPVAVVENYFGRTADAAITITNSSNVRTERNWIGHRKTYVNPVQLANRFAIVIRDSSSVTVGGDLSDASTSNDVWLDGARNCVVTIASGCRGLAVLSAQPVVRVTDSATRTSLDNIVTGTAICGAARTGVTIEGGAGARVVETWAESSLPIDLGGDGATANDACDSDSGPNAMQNAPTILRATWIGPERMRMAGEIEIIANTTVAIEPLYSASAGQNVTSGPGCAAAFDLTLRLADFPAVMPDSFNRTPTFFDRIVAISGTGTSEAASPASVHPGQPWPRSAFDGGTQNSLVWRNRATAANALWAMNGFAFHSIRDVVPLESPGRDLVGVANFNNAGTDLLFQDPTSGRAVIWMMNGTDPLGTHVLPQIPDGWSISGAADFDGDVASDVVLRNRATGANAVWTIAEGKHTAILDLPALPDTSWILAGTADLTGDGNADIFWRNGVTGANAVWVMTGTSVERIVDLPGLPDTAFRIGAIVDLNDDARPDIIWHNRETGANAIWRMDDLEIVSVIDLPAVQSTAWEMVGPR